MKPEVIRETQKMVQVRYRLTESAPLMTQAARENLGLTGALELAQDILSRTREPAATLDERTAHFLSTFQWKGNQPPISLEISPQDFTRHWKRASKKTSSSILGRHFGHYRAAGTDNTLAALHAKMCEIPYSKGYALQRWTHALTVMPEKEPGILDVEKLRAILLLEANFNLIDKLFFGNE